MGLRSKKHLTTGAKRKNRVQVMKQVWKKLRKGSSASTSTAVTSAVTQNMTYQHNSNNYSIDYDNSDDCLTDDVFEVEKETPEISNNYVCSGRRIVNIGHLFASLKAIDHKQFGCSFYQINITGEKRFGLKSVFTYKCTLCGTVGQFSTDNESSPCNVNDAAICGTVAIGAGYSQFTEFCSALDIPQMSERTYNKIENRILKKTEELAQDEMIEAGKKEYQLAVEANEIDSDGLPYITVIVDGAWSKRSYKTNYNALSGVGCIIGARTKKVLYVGVKNKLCKFCQFYEKKNKNVPFHNCFKNWDNSSTSMEAAIILKGFKKSVQMHGLRYKKIIGDGDSSVIKKIRTGRPYGPTFFVEKIECRNHVLRNFCNKIRDIAKTPKTDINIRNFLKSNILKFRTAIVAAIRYRKVENVTLFERIENLKKDILNSPRHLFGNHIHCDTYFCKNKAEIDPGYYSKFVNCKNLSDLFFSALNRVANLSSSLLYDVDNNSVECYNSVLNKLVGGKRINFSLRGSYQGRCYAAAISFNNKGTYVFKLLQKLSGAGIFTKKFCDKKFKKSVVNKSCKRKIRLQSADSDYGKCDSDSNSNVSDMSQSEYEHQKELFLKTLATCDIGAIQKKTCGQRNNEEWEKERNIRLTASNFGKVCKMRLNTNTANAVKNILYNKFNTKLPNAIAYGISHEVKAVEKFQEMTGFKVIPCGLFIDDKKHFLGASPDGLIGEDSIIEIKCPYAARNETIACAISQKHIKYCEMDPNNEYKIILKSSDTYMYQIQGQLHITKRQFCYFIVYTEIDCKYTIIERNDDF